MSLLGRFSILILALCVALVATGNLLAADGERLNIVFCFADDWGRYASAYAALDSRPTPCQVVRTPHIDAVARDGVLFRHAFVNAPSCTPCRSSLLSGQYFFRTGLGAILVGAKWDSSIPSWPLALADHGYHVGETWKVWSPGTPADAPFGAGKYAYEKGGGQFNNFSENVTKLVESGVELETAKQRMLDSVRRNFDQFLAARPAGSPFCYWFGPTNVHRTWVKGSGAALWKLNPDELRGKLPKFLPDVPEVREDFADYLGETQAWDAAIGVIVERLRAAGELDRTILVISGDHGAPGFPGGKCNLYDFGVHVSLVVRWPGKPAGRVVDDFVSLVDLAPTLLEGAGAPPLPGLSGRSLLPLLSSDQSGRIDESRDGVITGRERHVGSAREGNLPYPQRALRTKDYLYIRNFRPERWPLGDPRQVTDDSAPDAKTLETETRAAFADMDAGPTKAWLVAHRHEPQWKWHYDYAFGRRPLEELYVLAADPDQIKNEAENPRYAEVKRRLWERLRGELERSGDPRVTGDGETFERPPFTAPER